MVAYAIEFDWDAENTRHLAWHRVTPAEFEQVIRNEPVDLDYETVGGEERYKSIGPTDSARLVVVVWTVRRGKIRAVTAFPATAPYRKICLENR